MNRTIFHEASQWSESNIVSQVAQVSWAYPERKSENLVICLQPQEVTSPQKNLRALKNSLLWPYKVIATRFTTSRNTRHTELSPQPRFKRHGYSLGPHVPQEHLRLGRIPLDSSWTKSILVPIVFLASRHTENPRQIASIEQLRYPDLLRTGEPQQKRSKTHRKNPSSTSLNL